jgi:cytochrome b6-f complex iron-sulfur subunit
MERRQFIKYGSAICLGGIGLSTLLQSCGAVHYATHYIENNRLKVSKKEFVDPKRGAREFVVVKTDQLRFPVCIYHKEKKYTALSMECTHQGCELQPNKVLLVCPCHGSEFSNQGKVLSPPAETDLKQFKVFSNDEFIFVEI